MADLDILEIRSWTASFDEDDGKRPDGAVPLARWGPIRLNEQRLREIVGEHDYNPGDLLDIKLWVRDDSPRDFATRDVWLCFQPAIKRNKPVDPGQARCDDIWIPLSSVESRQDLQPQIGAFAKWPFRESDFTCNPIALGDLKMLRTKEGGLALVLPAASSIMAVYAFTKETESLPLPSQ